MCLCSKCDQKTFILFLCEMHASKVTMLWLSCLSNENLFWVLHMSGWYYFLLVEFSVLSSCSGTSLQDRNTLISNQDQYHILIAASDEHSFSTSDV